MLDTILFLFALGSPDATTAKAAPQDTAAPHQWLLHDEPRSKGMQAAIDAFAEATKSLSPRGESTVQTHLDLRQQRVDSIAAEYGFQPRLQALRWLLGKGGDSLWTVTYNPGTAVLRYSGVDRDGIEVLSACKVRSVEKDSVTEPHQVAIKDCLAVLVDTYRSRRQQRERLAATDYTETVRWLDDEDPPHPGFSWSYVPVGPQTLAQVDELFGSSSLAQAGLRVGDQVTKVGDQVVPFPALFGRCMQTLQPDQPLQLEVLRNGEAHTLQARVHRSSEVVPAYEAEVIGQPIPELVADQGGVATRISAEALRGKLVVFWVFDPQREESWDPIAPLVWLRGRWSPEQIEIVAIGTGSDSEAKEFLTREHLPFPRIFDPGRELARTLHVVQFPSLLIADRNGILRFRQARDLDLQHAVETLARQE